MMIFKLNGKRVTCKVASNRTLLDLLRVDLGVTSVKRGCEQGECGACTVLLDGKPVNSCMVLADRVNWKNVTTIEGLKDDSLMTTLQRAFMEEGAIQCGYCTPGMLISSYALLKEHPSPSADKVKMALEGNICRCTGYVNIIKAVLKAAERTITE
jgi:carbon-monoxide dehydrogenase small subunit